MSRKEFIVICLTVVFLLNSSASFGYTEEEQHIYDNLLLQLPWLPAKYMKLTQENKDTPTHTVGSVDEYALDFGLTSGTPVVAAEDGVAYVYKVGHTSAPAYGNHIKIDHGYFYTLYAHLSSADDKINGYEVKKGDIIGLSGNTGVGTGAHLHFGLYHGNAWSDGYSYSVKSKIVVANEGLGPYRTLESTQFEYLKSYLSGNFESGQEGIIVCESDGCYVDASNGTGGSGALPDFIVKKIWLELPGVGEAYEYMMGESINTKAQSKNIGLSSCIGDITGHFYLSKGYNEDAHSKWRRLDSTTTQCSNLDPGETNTETKNTNISEWITEPGIYNIVYCIDHPQDDNNNGGDYLEEHESNNCSTEAVFEVVGPGVDLVPTQPTGKSWSQLTDGEKAAIMSIIFNR